MENQINISPKCFFEISLEGFSISYVFVSIINTYAVLEYSFYI